MAERANITSVDAIQAFRTNVIIFLSKARPALEEASSEVMRVRRWLEMERRPHWLKQYLLRTQRLEEAEANLFSAKMTSSAASAMQQGAVQKARAAVGEAEDKLRSIKRWQRDYENRTDPLLKQLEKLENALSLDMPNAVAFLNDVVDTLQKYSSMVAPGGDAAGTASSETESPEAEGKKA
jgi:hypothetical protein